MKINLDAIMQRAKAARPAKPKRTRKKAKQQPAAVQVIEQAIVQQAPAQTPKQVIDQAIVQQQVVAGQTPKQVVDQAIEQQQLGLFG